MFPVGRAPLQKGSKTLVGIMGFHEAIQVQGFKFAQATAQIADQGTPCGSQCTGQRDGTLGCKVGIKISQRRRFRVVRNGVHQAHGLGFDAAYRTSREKEVFSIRLIDAVRQQGRSRRGKNTEQHFRLTEFGIRCCKNGATRERNFQPAPQTLTAHSGENRPREFNHVNDQRVQRAEHGSTTLGQVLFDAGTEAEMRPFGIEQHREQAWVSAMCIQRRLQRRNHGGIDYVGLGPGQTQPQQCTVVLEPDFEG